MSEDFIPFNQSTPVHHVRDRTTQNQRNHQNNWNHSGNRRGGYNKWNRHNSQSSQRNSSFSDNNSSYGRDAKSNIDAYLHPSMLQDPWAQFQQKKQ